MALEVSTKGVVYVCLTYVCMCVKGLECTFSYNKYFMKRKKWGWGDTVWPKSSKLGTGVAVARHEKSGVWKVKDNVLHAKNKFFIFRFPQYPQISLFQSNQLIIY